MKFRIYKSRGYWWCTNPQGRIIYAGLHWENAIAAYSHCVWALWR